MVLSWQRVRFELKETFSISYGSYSYREALIVTLSKNNFTGYGECTAIDYYQIDLNSFVQKLSLIQSNIEKQKIDLPSKFYNFLLSLNLPSFLRSALDCAYWDLYGKLENKSFLNINNIKINTLTESTLTISVNAIDKQIEKIKASSWNRFKVKLNKFDVRNIQAFLELDKCIALDANGSFTVQECEWLQNLEASKDFIYIEQPTKQGEYKSLSRNFFPNWMADEDCHVIDDLPLLKPHFQTINIKLVKCGGLTPALAFIEEAKKQGFKTMIGCMTESTIGISAGAVLAPLVDFVDLDGANLISNDIASGSKVVNGKIYLSDNHGLGIAVL
jgi:L-Ala-D/L-Glu epimerase